MKIHNCGPDRIDAHGWEIQRGYVYRVILGDDTPTEFESGDQTIEVGYHGMSVPPCGADYLYEDNKQLLVISCESDPSKINALDGVTLEPIKLEAGDHYHDGTFEFRVLSVDSDGETVLAGRV